MSWMPLGRLRLSVLPWWLTLTVILGATTGAQSVIGVEVTTQPSDTDWTQFLGPNRNAVTEGAALAAQWPENGPPVLWRIPCATGHAGPMVKDGVLVLMDRPAKPKGAVRPATAGGNFAAAGQLPDETIHGLSAETGAELWRVTYPCATIGDQYFFGPSATPAATNDGHVICFCGSGVLRCLELKTGKLVWEKDLVAEYGIAQHGADGKYDVCSSPLVVGDLVLQQVCSPTAGIVAWRAADGKEVWKTSGFPNYGSSLTLMQWEGRSAALAITVGKSPAEFTGRPARDVMAIDPQTGKLLWFGSAQKTYYNAPVAIANEGFVLVEGGGGDGPTVAFAPRNFDGSQAPQIWQDEDHNVRFSNYLIYRGLVFGQGFKGHRGVQTATLWCVDARGGELLWQQGVKEMHQTMLGSDGKVLQLHENGELSLFSAERADSYHELARAKVTTKTWSVPALVRGKLYVRSDTELVCLDLTAKP